jgi:hypothetical protein
MNKLRMSKKRSHRKVKSKKNLDRVVLLLGDKREFDTIVDLRNTVFTTVN